MIRNLQKFLKVEVKSLVSPSIRNFSLLVLICLIPTGLLQSIDPKGKFRFPEASAGRG